MLTLQESSHVDVTYQHLFSRMLALTLPVLNSPDLALNKSHLLPTLFNTALEIAQHHSLAPLSKPPFLAEPPFLWSTPFLYFREPPEIFHRGARSRTNTHNVGR